MVRSIQHSRSSQKNLNFSDFQISLKFSISRSDQKTRNSNKNRVYFNSGNNFRNILSTHTVYVILWPLERSMIFQTQKITRKTWKMIIILGFMSFEDQRVDLFRSFQTKYGLVPGFQGDYDLRSLFGDLVDDPSFVRDRVSSFSFVRSSYLCGRSSYFILSMFSCVLWSWWS